MNLKDIALAACPPFLREYAERVGASPESKRLLREGLCVAGGQFASTVGLLVGMRVLTEFVPPEVFGAVSLLLGVVVLGFNFFCAPLLQATLRYYPELASAGRLAVLRLTVTRDLRCGTLLMAVLLLLGGAAFGLGTELSFWSFAVLAGLLVLDARRTLETNFLTAARRQLPFALWGSAEAWAKPALAILAVLALGATPQAVLGGYLAATASVLAIFLLVVRRDGLGEEVTSEEGPDLRRELRRYALPLAPLALVGWIASLSDRYIIGGLLGSQAVGIYAAAYALTSRPFLMACSVIGTTLRPVYYEAVASGNGALERKVLRAWLAATAGICVVGAVAVFFLREWLAALLLAEAYRGSAALMPWIALGFFVLCVAQIFNTVSLAYKKGWYVFVSEATAAGGCLLFGIPLTWAFGLQGAAWAVPFYFSLQLASAWWLSRPYRLGKPQ